MGQESNWVIFQHKLLNNHFNEKVSSRTLHKYGILVYLYKSPNYTLHLFTFMPKIGIGLPKTGFIFYCVGGEFYSQE